MTSILKKALAPYVPTADDLEADTQYIIDGTLLPCWSWASRTGPVLRQAQDHRCEHERRRWAGWLMAGSPTAVLYE